MEITRNSMIEMFEECTTCEGKGKAVIVEVDGPTHLRQLVDCSACKGTGYTSEKVSVRDLTLYIGMQVTTRGGG